MSKYVYDGYIILEKDDIFVVETSTPESCWKALQKIAQRNGFVAGSNCALCVVESSTSYEEKAFGSIA